MTVPPAFEIVLEAHGKTVTLRASLRAAVTIDAMPGGLPSTWDQIARQSYSTIRAVIIATATNRQDAHHYLKAIADMPLRESLPDAQAACLAVLASVIPEQEQATERHAMLAEAIPLSDYFQNLYDYATGWIGWTLADTWGASPAEIEAAFSAHVDRLVKMTPGASAERQPAAAAAPDYTPERLQEIEELGYDPAFDREGLRALAASIN